MRYCVNCGKELIENAAFCVACGTPVPAEETAPIAPVVAEPAVVCEAANQEEVEFLENTHRLLRWEMKAWNIAGKVLTIMGIVFAAFFELLSLFSMVAMLDGDEEGLALVIVCTMYAIIFGGMLIAFGIISRKAAGKIPQYLDSLYTDLSLTYNRCGSIGMLIFTAIFGIVSPVFFIINFVRMKANRDVIERILRNQNVQG